MVIIEKQKRFINYLVQKIDLHETTQYCNYGEDPCFKVFKLVISFECKF